MISRVEVLLKSSVDFAKLGLLRFLVLVIHIREFHYTDLLMYLEEIL